MMEKIAKKVPRFLCEVETTMDLDKAKGMIYCLDLEEVLGRSLSFSTQK